MDVPDIALLKTKVEKAVKIGYGLKTGFLKQIKKIILKIRLVLINN
jgi:hypothetical protein